MKADILLKLNILVQYKMAILGLNHCKSSFPRGHARISFGLFAKQCFILSVNSVSKKIKVPILSTKIIQVQSQYVKKYKCQGEH